jgi:hypothetical protein
MFGLLLIGGYEAGAVKGELVSHFGHVHNFLASGGKGETAKDG